MASYTDLAAILTDETMLAQVDVAILIAAKDLLAGTPTAEDRRWARQALYAPRGESQKAWKFLVAKFNAVAIAAITGADNATIQAEVDEVVPALVQAMAGS